LFAKLSFRDTRVRDMTQAAPHGTAPVRAAQRFDEDALAGWMRAHIVGFEGPLSVRQFKGGQSNPTFWLGAGGRAYVLRKKPPGKLLPSAHAVEREHRVMHALRDSAVPVPRVLGLCEDASVIGTPFFVMEHVEGRIFWNLQLPGLDESERGAIYQELVRVLALLHAVDYRALGLGDFGKAEGYVARQVRRWSEQYRASQTEEVAPMDALISWLPEHLPSGEETALTHGDYRLDNILFHPTEPRALAVIDWELSTLGHPLADLAYTCMLYDVALPRVGGLAGVDCAAIGIPTERELLDGYRRLSGRETIAEFSYFKAFSLFRLAAIAQGVYRRALEGNASSEDAAMYGGAVRYLAEIACGLVGLEP
jgi:aminoglycoside phosphotransferase (APT) family kinase protein